MIDFHNLTLSDFCNMEVATRTDGTATVLVDEFKGKMVALAGFSTDAGKSDYEVQEEAYYYYKDLIGRLKKAL